MAEDNRDIISLVLKDGTVVIETRPDLAPKHVAQIKKLVSSFQILEESYSKDIYKINIKILYNDIKVKKLLGQINILFSQLENISAVFYPVLFIDGDIQNFNETIQRKINNTFKKNQNKPERSGLMSRALHPRNKEESIRALLELIKEWGKTHNLMSRAGIQQAHLHVEDSLSIVKKIKRQTVKEIKLGWKMNSKFKKNFKI